MSTDSRKILIRQGYKELRPNGDTGATIWQSPTGRRVALLDDGRIFTKADIEARARENCGPDTRDYYLSIVHNWE